MGAPPGYSLFLRSISAYNVPLWLLVFQQGAVGLFMLLRAPA